MRLPDGGTFMPPRGADMSGGCACNARGAGGAPPIGLALIGLALIAVRARRRRA